MPNFKTIQHRDKKWLLEQRNHSCVLTSSPQVEVAHIRKGTHTGLSQKPSDWNTLPLDFRLHRGQHQEGEISFWLRQANDYPLFLMETITSFAKLRYLTWLVSNGREEEAIRIIGE